MQNQTTQTQNTHEQTPLSPQGEGREKYHNNSLEKGIEPLTLWLKAIRFSQLSYPSLLKFVSEHNILIVKI